MAAHGQCPCITCEQFKGGFDVSGAMPRVSLRGLLTKCLRAREDGCLAGTVQDRGRPGREQTAEQQIGQTAEARAADGAGERGIKVALGERMGLIHSTPAKKVGPHWSRQV